MEFGIEKCATLIKKKQQRETTERVELPNQESLKTLGEKENCKYLGILEADTIKKTDIKKKKKKSISEGQKKPYSKSKTAVEISSKK